MKKEGNRWEGCYTKVIQFGVFWNQKSCAAGWYVFEMKPGHSIAFKKAIDKIQSDNFKIDWTAGEQLANLRFVRDVTVQLSTKLIQSLECSATIQMNKSTVTYAILINTNNS